jgi:hypothetical protein
MATAAPVNFDFGQQKDQRRPDRFVLKARFRVTPVNVISKKDPIAEKTFFTGKLMA